MKKYISLILIFSFLNIYPLYAVTAKFTKVWIEHNVVRNGVLGLAYHFDATITGAKGLPVYVIASIDSKPGYGINDTNGQYRLANGVIGSSLRLNVISSPAYCNDMYIWMPISELHIPVGTDTDWHVHLAVMINDDPLVSFKVGNIVTWSEFVSFRVMNNPNRNNSNAPNNNNNSNRNTNGSPSYSGFAEHMYFTNNGQYLHVNVSSNFGINVMNGMGYIYNERSSKIRDEGGYHIFGGESFFGLVKPTFKMNSNYTELYFDNRTYVRSTKEKYDEYSRNLDAFNKRHNIETNPFKNTDTGGPSTNTNNRNNNTSRGTCSKCGGRKYESQRFFNSPASTKYYLNVAGNLCRYCGYNDKHYHYPCSSCNGTGHN